MKSITHNEMKIISTIFKNPEIDYNAHQLAKKIGISSMGALKIAKRLTQEGILTAKQLGRATFYQINYEHNYALEYIKFLLKRETEQTKGYAKRWIEDLKRIKHAEAAILFGSVLHKKKEAKDIDVMFITTKKKFSKLKKEVVDMNVINVKKIHPVYQTLADFKKNLRKEDKVVLNIIKGIVIFGEEKIIEARK